jgi:hypothetical protein
VVRDQRRGGLLDLLRRELCAAKAEAKALGHRPRVISGGEGELLGFLSKDMGISLGKMRI